MKRVRVSISGVMVLVALVAMDLAVMRAVRGMPRQAEPRGILESLPMANVLTIYLVIVVSSLLRRGEAALSHAAFLLCGGTAIVVFLTVANLAPYFYFFYLGDIWGVLLRTDPRVRPAFSFWVGVASSVLNPTLLIPALLGGWMTRGYRLKLLKGSVGERKSGRVLTADLLAVVAVTAILFAIDLAVSRSLHKAANTAVRIGTFGALPMVHVLAVCLVIVVSRLVRRREVPLSFVSFLFCGGTAILLLGALVDLAPQLLTTYFTDTAVLWESPAHTVVDLMRFGTGRIALIEALIVFGAVTPLLLVPAALLGWMTRGYRLRLFKGPGSSTAGNESAT